MWLDSKDNKEWYKGLELNDEIFGNIGRSVVAQGQRIKGIACHDGYDEKHAFIALVVAIEHTIQSHNHPHKQACQFIDKRDEANAGYHAHQAQQKHPIAHSVEMKHGDRYSFKTIIF
ncbi:Uncharacterised protein [Chlamydia trachomatis]|nr:Uncharacterised protein [Chlamydia trachomatis]